MKLSSAHLWTHNPGRLSFSDDLSTFRVKTNFPAFLPPQPVGDQVKQNESRWPFKMEVPVGKRRALGMCRELRCH